MSDSVAIDFVSFHLEQWFVLAIFGVAGNTGNTGNNFRNKNKIDQDLG
jgi:hypothetical protein